jgi:phospholipase C
MNQPTGKSEDQDLPSREDSSIKHAVVMLMENRSLGFFPEWLRKADSKKRAVKFVNKPGESRAAHSYSDNNIGCLFSARHHHNRGVLVEHNKGFMGTFLRAVNPGVISVGYADECGVPVYDAFPLKQTAPAHYFASILGPTFANRAFLSAAQSERKS